MKKRVSAIVLAFAVAFSLVACGGSSTAPAGTDSSCFRVSMLTFATSDGDTGINVSAEDVMTIMGSLKAK